MTVTTYDVERHRRDRLRKLELRVDGLTRYRDQLERAYALACSLIAATRGADPTHVAAIIHELAEAPAQGVDDAALVTLLRETAA